LILKWQTSINSSFNRLPNLKHKKLRILNLNYRKLAEKGEFDFHTNDFHLKINQLEIMEFCKLGDENQMKIRPNTRLIMKSYKEFLSLFDCLKIARDAFSSDKKSKSYWAGLSYFMSHVTKAILRTAFYVHESAEMQKASIALPPIYIIESDDSPPQPRLETVYEYIIICLYHLNVMQRLYEQKNDRNTDQKLKYCNRLKFFRLILNCLIRLIQVSSLIRDDLITKQTRTIQSENGSTKLLYLDLYSHYICNECKLIKEYLKQIFENSE
jgi:hypothetical protein